MTNFKNWRKLVLLLVLVSGLLFFSSWRGSQMWTREKRVFVPLEPCFSHCPKKGRPLKISVISNGQTRNDYSFNSSVDLGIKVFSEKFKQFVTDNQEWRNFSGEIDFRWLLMVNDVSFTSIIESYLSAAFWKADFMIAIGFFHEEVLKAIPNYHFLNSSKVRFIFIDGKVEGIPGLESAYFASELAGVKAGVASALHALKNFPGRTAKFSTFGAFNSLAITRYMTGFYWGEEWVRRLLEGGRSKDIDWIRSWLQQPSLPGKQVGDFENKKLRFLTLSNQFTNGLNIGGAVSISDKLLDYGVNYILPVAGVQGFDTLREVKKFGSNAWVIGVDTNFAILFPDYNDLIIFSAIKRCDLAVLYSLWDGFKISAKEEKQEKYGNKNSSNKFFTLGRSFLYTTEEKGIINGLVSGNVWNFNRFFDDLFSDPRIISLQQNALSFVQLHPTDLWQKKDDFWNFSKEKEISKTRW